MAKVLNPFFAGEARGSVGSITASRSRAGAIIRQNGSPVQPRSNSQQLQRYNVQSLTSDFQNLTSAQIQQWQDFADANPVTDVFGNSILLSAINWYVRLNSRLLTAGQTLLTTPPATANPGYSPTINAFWDTVSNTGIDFSFSPVPATNQRIWLQWSGNVPLTRNFLSRDTRQRQIVTNSDSSPLLIIPVADVIANSQRHITAFATDEFGRATPRQRWSVEEQIP